MIDISQRLSTITSTNSEKDRKNSPKNIPQEHRPNLQVLSSKEDGKDGSRGTEPADASPSSSPKKEEYWNLEYLQKADS